MRSNKDLGLAFEQLNAQGKTVLAIDSKHVMCNWIEDGSYVTWQWYIVNNKVAVYIGHYFKDEESAIKDFHDRV